MGPEIASPQVRQSPDTERAPWWRTASRLQLICAGMGLVILIFGVLSGLDVFIWFSPDLAPLLPIADLFVALLCGGLMGKIIYDARARSRLVQQHLQVVAEMNHHIRNALQDIEFTTHTAHSREATESIDRAVSRVEWALREILPRDLKKHS
jgi:ABC-type multidrug transport system fused ATPase/permease subunit